MAFNKDTYRPQTYVQKRYDPLRGWTLVSAARLWHANGVTDSLTGLSTVLSDAYTADPTFDTLVIDQGRAWRTGEEGGTQAALYLTYRESDVFGSARRDLKLSGQFRTRIRKLFYTSSGGLIQKSISTVPNRTTPTTNASTAYLNLVSRQFAWIEDTVNYFEFYVRQTYQGNSPIPTLRNYVNTLASNSVFGADPYTVVYGTPKLEMAEISGTRYWYVTHQYFWATNTFNDAWINYATKNAEGEVLEIPMYRVGSVPEAVL